MKYSRSHHSQGVYTLSATLALRSAAALALLWDLPGKNLPSPQAVGAPHPPEMSMGHRQDALGCSSLAPCRWCNPCEKRLAVLMCG